MNSDERLRRMEAWLSNLYKDAEEEMRGKWDGYMARQEKRSEKLLKAVDDARTPEEKQAAEAKYQAHLKSVTSGSEYYRGMVEELARQYHDVNVQAAKIVNGQRAEFFADGYNFSAGEINTAAISHDVGIRFDLCSAEAVEWLAERQNDLLLPGPREPKAREDMTWNIRNINSQVAQGIVQGESIPKIAARLRNVSNMNLKSSVRNARTMATGCQNGGRVQAMKTAEEWGVHTRKQWLSQHDGRTRHTHDDPPPKGVSGEIVGPDDWFSNNCRFPGDPVGPASEVYNCRCTLITVVDGFSSNLPKGKEDTVHIWIDGEEVTSPPIMTQPIARNVVQGEDLSGTFKRREDEFRFEIDDVINAQGFDGLPRVVSADEFDKAVKDNGIICKRGYTAPDSETLVAYQDALYNGKWYVDCSRGGAAFGQGMYAVGAYGERLNDHMQSVVDGYGRGENGRVETFTLVDAKIINHDDINKERWKVILEMRMKELDDPLTENQMTLFKLMSGYPATAEEAEEGYKLLTNKEDVRIATEAVAKVSNKEDVNRKHQELMSMDDGVFAAMRGYDAIEVDLNRSGDMYFVVLNRTKVVFKGD